MEAIGCFSSRQRDLLGREREEEESQWKEILSVLDPKQWEHCGIGLRRVRVKDVSTGLLGRILVSFGKGPIGVDVPIPDQCRFSAGDIVGIRRQESPADVVGSGVVSSVSQTRITIAFDESSSDADDELAVDWTNESDGNDGSVFHMHLLPNDVTHRRHSDCLQKLSQFRDGCSSRIIGIAFEQFKATDFRELYEGKQTQTTGSNPEPNSTEPQPQSQSQSQPSSLCFRNTSLNAWQQNAVQLAVVNRPPLVIVHGPPGTGKTTTVVELIAQCVQRGERILVCAPSNVAVDNLAIGLLKFQVPIVRLGHPARISPQLYHAALSSRIQESDSASLCADIRKEMTAVSGEISKLRKRAKKHNSSGGGGGGGGSGGEPSNPRAEIRRAFRDLKQSLNQLRRELRSREEDGIYEVLRNFPVVLSTLTGAAPDGPLRCLRKSRRRFAGPNAPPHPSDHDDDDTSGTSSSVADFDVVVIDECAQALEVSCWMALMQGRRAVLAGDHCQLPPTILSDSAARDGLSVTLMERLLARKDVESMCTRLLRTQYRMNSVIMKWSSDAFYGGKLIADPSVEDHRLIELPNVDPSVPELNDVFLFLDTAGCDMYETSDDAVPDTEDGGGKSRNPISIAGRMARKSVPAAGSNSSPNSLLGSGSKANFGEADIVVAYVRRLYQAGIRLEDIAVISPYSFQVETLRSRFLQSNVASFMRPEKKSSNSAATAAPTDTALSAINPVIPSAEQFFAPLEIRTVDGYQGRERELVILSLVRSNPNGVVGFLAEDRRLNVAITRARRQVCVVGDSNTIRKHEFLNRLFEYVEKNGVVRSALEFDEVEAVQQMIRPSEPAPIRTVVKAPSSSSSVNDVASSHESVVNSSASKSESGIGGPPNATPNAAADVQAQKTPTYRETLQAQLEDFINAPAADDSNLEIPAPTNTTQRKVLMQLLGSKNLFLISNRSSKTADAFVTISKSAPVPPSPSAAGAVSTDDAKFFKSQYLKDVTDEPAVLLKESNPTVAASSRSSASPSSSSSSVATSPVATPSPFQKLSKCVQCGAEIPQPNMMLHLLRCRPASSSASSSSSSSSSSSVNNSKSGSSASSKSSAKPEVKPIPLFQQRPVTDEEDLDEVLESFKFSETHCPYPSCNKNVELIGHYCQFCKRKFCLGHGLAELHGCSRDAKSHARARSRERHERSQPGLISQGPSSRSSRADSKNAIHERLAKKIAEQQAARAKKTSDNSKKK